MIPFDILPPFNSVCYTSFGLWLAFLLLCCAHAFCDTHNCWFTHLRRSCCCWRYLVRTFWRKERYPLPPTFFRFNPLCCGSTLSPRPHLRHYYLHLLPYHYCCSSAANTHYQFSLLCLHVHTVSSTLHFIFGCLILPFLHCFALHFGSFINFTGVLPCILHTLRFCIWYSSSWV